MLSKNERFNLIKTRKICFRSKLWSNSDYRNAMELRCISSHGLKFVRENICPLPAYITLCKKFSFMHLIPGFMKPMMLYLSKTLPKNDPKKNLFMILFDEVKITNKGQLDRKLDMIIGANKDNVCSINIHAHF